MGTTLFYVQKQPQEVFCKRGVLGNFAKFIGKHLCQSLSFNKVATLLKERLWHRCFPVNFAKFLRIPFLQKTSGVLQKTSDHQSCREFDCQESAWLVKITKNYWLISSNFRRKQTKIFHRNQEQNMENCEAGNLQKIRTLNLIKILLSFYKNV